MRIGKLREDGKHAIESHCDVAEDARTGRFEKTSCVVVYGDTDQPSHSVRIFKSKDDQ